MAKVSKQFKKFASSGKLKDTIKSRRKNQEIKRKVEDRNQRRAHQRGAPKERPGHSRRALDEEDDEEEGDEREVKRLQKVGGKAGGIAKNVEELFGGQLDAEEEEDDELSAIEDEELEDEDEDEVEDASDDGLDEMNEAEMKKAMKNLEKTDPEFWKYLKENDRELLEFEGAQSSSAVKGKKAQAASEEDDELESGDEAEEDEDDDDDDDDDDEEEVDSAPKKTSVTMKMLRGWQQGMVQQHSLRSLRKMLLAFRAAAHMNEDDADQGTGRDTKYTVDSAAVFNKLILTALKFTPVVLAHHIPYRTLHDGRIKVSQPKKPNASLSRLILSHVTTLLHFIKSLPAISSDGEGEAGKLLVEAIGESGKLLPWFLGARKHLRAYLKTLLDLWSTGSDNVKIASFLAVRRMYVGGDDALRDLCLKNTYKSLLPSLRHTTPHTLPSINILKNTAAELFCVDPARSYPHAFTFIRTLAVHLRNVVRGTTSAPSKAKGGKTTDTAEAFRSVYNWQYVHCIDFWTQVLAQSCDVDAQRERGGVESELRPLIYPLVQIALGVVRLLPSSRYFPLRFHLLHSLLRLITRTKTYIPLSPFLLEILDSAEFKRSNPQKSTLKPLDLEYVIRAPPSYPKTRVYQETLGEELVYLLGEYHAAIAGQIAFPEMVLPILITLRRHLKKGSAGSPKVQAGFKVLIEKLEATQKWIENKRRNVGFSPKDRGELVKWSESIKGDDTPLGGWIKVQRKVREKRRNEVERAFREEREGRGAKGEESEEGGMEDEDEDEEEEEDEDLEMDSD